MSSGDHDNESTSYPRLTSLNLAALVLFHIFTRSSFPQDATYVPLWEKAMSITWAEWPLPPTKPSLFVQLVSSVRFHTVMLKFWVGFPEGVPEPNLPL